MHGLPDRLPGTIVTISDQWRVMVGSSGDRDTARAEVIVPRGWRRRARGNDRSPRTGRVGPQSEMRTADRSCDLGRRHDHARTVLRSVLSCRQRHRRAHGLLKRTVSLGDSGLSQAGPCIVTPGATWRLPILIWQRFPGRLLRPYPCSL